MPNEPMPAGSLRVCGRLVETGQVTIATVAGGRVTSVAEGQAPHDIGGPDVWLAPGFLDLMVNGYAGRDLNAGADVEPGQVADNLRAVAAMLARAGTPLFCPTVYTGSHESMLGSLASLGRAIEGDTSLARAAVGIHVEGPYISPEEGPVGAHPREHVRPPDWGEFQRFQEAAGGRIRLLTLAPESGGALPFIEKLIDAGVVVAIGHTAADGACIGAAALAGARLSTHLGNGAHAVMPRHPNYIWEQLAHDGLFASLIADGHHLPPAVVKCMLRAKGPDRVALTSDVTSLGGLPPGIYSGGRHEVMPSGKVVLAGTPYLAGAGHLLDTGVANAMRFAGISVAQAAACASAVPARILGLEGAKGSIRVGRDADLTLFRVRDEGSIETVATLRAGEVVYRAA